MQGAKNEEFSLSSGDFPTLGSEKDKSPKNSELLGMFLCLVFLVEYPVIILLHLFLVMKQLNIRY